MGLRKRDVYVMSSHWDGVQVLLLDSSLHLLHGDYAEKDVDMHREFHRDYELANFGFAVLSRELSLSHVKHERKFSKKFKKEARARIMRELAFAHARLAAGYNKPLLPNEQEALLAAFKYVAEDDASQATLQPRRHTGFRLFSRKTVAA